jgi:hypothetical protein
MCENCVILQRRIDELNLRIAGLEMELEEPPDRYDIDGRD